MLLASRETFDQKNSLLSLCSSTGFFVTATAHRALTAKDQTEYFPSLASKGVPPVPVRKNCLCYEFNARECEGKCNKCSTTRYLLC